MADAVNGTILQLVKHGAVLATPEAVVDGLSTPEGIDIKGQRMYVVESGTDSLTRIHLRSGMRATLVTGLGLAPPPLPFIFPVGLLNNVVVDGHDIYVNADRANVIYEF